MEKREKKERDVRAGQCVLYSRARIVLIYM
jgi:hypothetical protein